MGLKVRIFLQKKGATGLSFLPPRSCRDSNPGISFDIFKLAAKLPLSTRPQDLPVG